MIEDVCQLEFIRNYDWSFDTQNNSSTPHNFTFSENQPLKTYLVSKGFEDQKQIEVLMINDYSKQRNRFSILVRNAHSNTAVLYVRGSDSSMIPIIQKTEFTSQLSKLVSFNSERGLQSVIYGSKQMTGDQADEFIRKYKEALKASVDQEIKFLEIAKQMETSLQFESIVGIENLVKDDAKMTLQYLQQMGVNVHILCGDDLEPCMNTCRSLVLIDPKDKELVLEFTDLEGARSRMKNVIEVICKSLDYKPFVLRQGSQIGQAGSNE